MPTNPYHYDVIIIGASASGLMCAIEAGKRGRKVLVLDHANKAGKKILMSGGGKCNFTNLDIYADNYISNNPHFCKSALSRFTQWDFLALINEHNIAYEERDLGKLFCLNSAKDILHMLLDRAAQAKTQVQLRCIINRITKTDQFLIATEQSQFSCDSLVVASGGLSIPKMCASPIGYKIAEQFGHHIHTTAPALVPFTLHEQDKQRLSPLAGIAIECRVSNRHQSFCENVLFTHRGLSGPAILQISSYWQAGDSLEMDLSPNQSMRELLEQALKTTPNQQLSSVLKNILPKRVIQTFIASHLLQLTIKQLSQKQIQHLEQTVHHWNIKPNATEGYRTAEVTLGGVNCNEISSKTFESTKTQGLYFIGEVLDVTGWLGGYNFQWAWSSGWCAGQYV